MPLTSNRPGVFRARAFDRWDWRVVDPSYAGYEAEARADWERRVAPTNRPAAVRWAAWLSQPLCALALLALWRAAPDHMPLWLVLVLSAVGGGGIALVLLWRTTPTLTNSQWDELDTAAIRTVPPEIARSVADSTEQAQLWDFVTVYDAMERAEDDFYSWVASNAAIDDPVLRELSARESDRLRVRLDESTAAYGAVLSTLKPDPPYG